MCMGVRHLPRDFQGPDRELHHWTNSLSYTYRPILGFGVQIYRDGEDLTEIRQRPSNCAPPIFEGRCAAADKLSARRLFHAVVFNCFAASFMCCIISL